MARWMFLYAEQPPIVPCPVHRSSERSIQRRIHSSSWNENLKGHLAKEGCKERAPGACQGSRECSAVDNVFNARLVVSATVSSANGAQTETVSTSRAGKEAAQGTLLKFALVGTFQLQQRAGLSSSTKGAVASC
jgi:hypothetical protein